MRAQTNPFSFDSASGRNSKIWMLPKLLRMLGQMSVRLLRRRLLGNCFFALAYVKARERNQQQAMPRFQQDEQEPDDAEAGGDSSSEG